jgi:hypothetical protein
MRTPSELMELYVHHEQNNTRDQFFKVLSYEEVTIICMVIELFLKNPNITTRQAELYQVTLENFKNIRKSMLETN